MRRGPRPTRYIDLDNATKDLAFALVKVHEGNLISAFLNASMALVHISKHLTEVEWSHMLAVLRSPNPNSVAAQGKHQRKKATEEHVLTDLGNPRVGSEHPEQEPNDHDDEWDDGNEHEASSGEERKVPPT